MYSTMNLIMHRQEMYLERNGGTVQRQCTSTCFARLQPLQTYIMSHAI